MNYSFTETFLSNSGEQGNMDSTFESTTYLLNSNEEHNLPYYGDYLLKYRKSYASIHGYFSLVVCIFGIASNILNIIVLTRKNMISSTNALLTGLAVADTMAMSSYIPFAIHNYVRKDLEEWERYSYSWTVFILCHMIFSFISHTVSTWLTVTLAIWRFVAIYFPFSASRVCSMSRAKYAILSNYVACTVTCIPVYLTFTVSKFEEDGYTMYRLDFSEISQKNGKLLEKISFWFFSVISKLVPCIVLTIISLALIRTLYKINLEQRRLKVIIVSESVHYRITRMILAVLFLFLITKFPSGILALLSGILGVEFFDNVYSNFGETMDGLALINTSINFIIYCSMSSQFRDTFRLLFIPKILAINDKVPSSQETEHTAF